MIPTFLSEKNLTSLSKQYGLSAIWVFGSAIRDDYNPDSDIDLVIEFQPDAKPTLLTLAAMETELEKLTGRKIDLITRKAIDENMNPILRQEILSTMVPVYES